MNFQDVNIDEGEDVNYEFMELSILSKFHKRKKKRLVKEKSIPLSMTLG